MKLQEDLKIQIPLGQKEICVSPFYWEGKSGIEVAVLKNPNKGKKIDREKDICKDTLTIQFISTNKKGLETVRDALNVAIGLFDEFKK